jgi:hypothetical protein
MLYIASETFIKRGFSPSLKSILYLTNRPLIISCVHTKYTSAHVRKYIDYVQAIHVVLDKLRK